MSTQATTATTRRVCFTWLCALAPVWLLLASVLAMLGYRQRFGHWPHENAPWVQLLPIEMRVAVAAQEDAPADATLVFIALLFVPVALTHLLVTLIYHRQLGFGTSHVILMALVFVIGWVIYGVLTSQVRALGPFWMD